MDLLVLFRSFGRRTVTVSPHECLKGAPQPGVETGTGGLGGEKRIHDGEKRNGLKVKFCFKIW